MKATKAPVRDAHMISVYMDPPSRTWRAVCSCGVTGAGYRTRRAADNDTDIDAHRAAVAMIRQPEGVQP